MVTDTVPTLLSRRCYALKTQVSVQRRFFEQVFDYWLW
jgi:hypothetical protein